LAWLISWAMMLPAVIFAAPAIKAMSMALTRENQNQGKHSL
jgi:hypothetical protein